MQGGGRDSASEGDLKMATSTQLETIRHAKKSHVCSWCGEKIEVEEGYIRYLYYDGSDAGTVKEHPECHVAMLIEIAEYGPIEFTPGEFERGDPLDVPLSGQPPK